MTQATPLAASTGPGAARLLSDDQLARRATQGDQRAFAAIYRRYHQDLYRYCAAIVGNPEDAHDALQNTMVKVLRSLPGEQRRVQLKPWLYRIAHNESIELLRRRRPLEQIDPELAAGGPSAAETADLRQRLRRLIGDLDELPDRQRGALVMRELAGLSFKQIASAFGTSPAVARQTLYEARVGLQQMSEGREMRCEEICCVLSGGDRRMIRRRDIRAHLRACPDCRAFRDGISDRSRDLAAIAPLPAAAAAGLLHGILDSAHGASGAGVGGAAGAGVAGKALAGSALVKSVATVAVVAAVGVSAADRGGLIHVLPGGGNQQQREAQSSPGGSDQGAPATGQSAGEIGNAAGEGAGQNRQGLGKAAVRSGQANNNAASVPSSTTGANGHGTSAASAHGKETAASHSHQPHEHPTPGSHPGHASTPQSSKGASKKGGGASHGGRASHPSHAHQSHHPSRSHSHSHPPPHASPPPQVQTSPEGRAPDQSAGTTEQPAEP
jgi:RNA polymerase sigma factor (sigma-70 family)